MRLFFLLVATTLLTASCAGGHTFGGATDYLPTTLGMHKAPASRKLVVTSTSDDGPGSLRKTVAGAKKGSTITFHLRKKAKIVLTSGPISIATNLTISGPGASALSVSGDGKSEIFRIASRKSVMISGLTLTKGSAAQGGAVYNAGTLTLENDTLSLNIAPAGGGAAVSRGGARERFDPRPSAHNSRASKHPAAPRIPENSAGVGEGGAVYTIGKLVVSSCTFSRNAAGEKSSQDGAGGAVAQFGGTAKISGSTFLANVAGGGTGGSSGMGGAIYVTAGSLSLTGDTFENNDAGGGDYGYGGAVYDDGWFSGSKNTFTQNASYGKGAGGSAYGGAVYAGSGLSLSDSTFSGNKAAGGSPTVYGYAFGGAIDSESAASLTSMTLSANGASGGEAGSAEGGAIYLGGGASQWRALTFSSNSATANGANSYANGGAVSAFGPLAISGANAFTSNGAFAATSGAIGGQGGAVAVEVGPFAFTGSASKNSATTEGGAFWIGDAATITNSLLSNNSVAGVQNPNDGGGAVYVGLGGAITLTGSTLTANATRGSAGGTGGGGIFNLGSGTITNSTINANSSSVDGGGIENAAAGGFTLVNVTVDQNTASRNGGSLKNLYGDSSMTVTNSILARGVAGGASSDVSNDGTIVSGDYNIIETPATGTALSGPTAHNVNVDPVLASLANNGGPTPTEADGSASPGTAYIPYNNCLAVNVFVDQRGYPRDAKVNGYCDVGAYEDQTP